MIDSSPAGLKQSPIHAFLRVTQVAIIAVTAFALSACGDKNEVPPMQILHGEAVYKAECASCHGKNLEGQPDWRIRKADGKLPAPPHDDSGHTWHHPQEQLIAIIKLGMVPPNAPAGYVSDMPAFGAKLTDNEIKATLSYIESRWSPEIRAKRAERLAAMAAVSPVSPAPAK